MQIALSAQMKPFSRSSGRDGESHGRGDSHGRAHLGRPEASQGGSPPLFGDGDGLRVEPLGRL